MTIRDMAFDYAMQRGKGRKAHQDFYAGAKAVIREIMKSYEIGGVESLMDRLNFYVDEIKEG